MKALRLFSIAMAAVALLCGAALHAQTLPALEKASEITTGTLPDGISYYLVKNPNTPGFADFALVQPMRNDRKGTREDLVSLPHFNERKPYKFLSENGVGYSDKGYIQHFRDATVFRFADVPVFKGEVSDSVLLMIFDIARKSKYQQALVVSGNIDVSAVIERIRILSMTIPRRRSVEDSWDYSWKQQDKPQITTATTPAGCVTVRYRSPRTEREYMNTIQPITSRLLASEFDIILERRLRAAFIDSNIPLADYQFEYTGSDQTASDELYTISVYTSPEDLEKAVWLFAGVLSSLDNEGATLEELVFARTVIAEAKEREASNYKMSNAGYLDKCIAAYLYGSNLAPYTALRPVYSGRRLDAARERELLNRYIAASLSVSRNLHLRVTGPVKPNADKVYERFSEGWRYGCYVVGDVPVAADTMLLGPQTRKPKGVKLKTTSVDSFSGGKLWIFSNGISVVFKKTSDKDAFQYGLLIKGGWPEIPAVNGTEPAFARDVIATSKVAGLTAARFNDLLSMYGVTIRPDVTLSDVRMSGSAPPKSLSLVIKSMISVANNLEQDNDAYQRYCKEKPVRLVRDKFSEEGTRAVLDSIMCPDYLFAAGSLPQMPDSDFNKRVADYLNTKGANMKNGIIVLMGDLNENVTLKLLTRYLGELRTGQQRVVRPKIQYPLRSCWSTNYVQSSWRSHGISISLASEWPFSSEGYSQMLLACTMLKYELDKSLVSDGMYCSVSGSADLFPTEKMTIHIHCEPIFPSGLPYEVNPAMPIHALNTVREVINRLATEQVDPAELNFCKTTLTDRQKTESGNTAQLRDAVLERNSVGRDIRGGFSQRITGVQPSDMRKLFEALTGCTCEYVVQ